MTGFVTQVFQDGEVVGQANMINTFLNPIQVLSAYFPIQPAICSGIGTIETNFGQTSTTNVFVFTTGNFRFTDQANVINSDVYPMFTLDTTGSVTVTAAASPPNPLYIVATLTQTAIDDFQFSTSSVIESVAIPIASLTANQLAICKIVNNGGGVYTVSLDSNCAFNYNPVSGEDPYPDIVDNIATGAVTIGGRLAGATQLMTTFSSTNSDFYGVQKLSQITGGYIRSSLESYNGVSNNYALIWADYINNTNGTYKAEALMTVSDGAGFASIFTMAPLTTSPYYGFYNKWQNVNSANNIGVYENYLDTSGNPYLAQWLGAAGGPAATGIETPWGYRPGLLGTLSGLTTTSASIATLGDSAAGHGSQTYSYTGGTQGFTVPTYITNVYITGTGGGGGGAGGGGAGGAAGASFKQAIPVSGGDSLVIYIGKHGSGGTSGNDGTAGEDTTIVRSAINLLTLTGGGGGINATQVGGAGGSGGNLGTAAAGGQGNGGGKGAGDGAGNIFGGGGPGCAGGSPSVSFDGTLGAGGGGGGVNTGGDGGDGFMIVEW